MKRSRDKSTSYYFLVYFRIWYHQPAKSDPVPSPPIAYIDTMPHYLNPNEKHPKFESREHTVGRVNEQLRESPLPGN